MTDSPGEVLAVARDDGHRFSKPTRESVTLIAGCGVEGDGQSRAAAGGAR